MSRPKRRRLGLLEALALTLIGCGGGPGVVWVDTTADAIASEPAVTQQQTQPVPTTTVPIVQVTTDAGTVETSMTTIEDAGVVETSAPEASAALEASKPEAASGGYVCPLAGMLVQCDNGGASMWQFEVETADGTNIVPCTTLSPQCPSGRRCWGRVGGEPVSAICP